jgi:lysophospholipase L1-like esterase
LRNPTNHTVLRPAYSGPDHLHPNLVGYRAMARAVDLSLDPPMILEAERVGE